MRKFLPVILALILTLTCFTACGGDDEAENADTVAYSGILTKIKLGMPLTKVVSLNAANDVELYYETDTCLWSENPDTDLMEIRNLLSESEQFYYVDDSIITYNFKTVKGDEELYLDDYLTEVYCLLDRGTAEKYFDTKTAELTEKHGVEPTGRMTGTEGVDMEVNYIQRYDCSSYTLTFTMTEKYDTVNGVEGYYGSYFSVDVQAKEVKNEVEIQTNADNKKETEAETSEEET